MARSTGQLARTWACRLRISNSCKTSHYPGSRKYLDWGSKSRRIRHQCSLCHKLILELLLSSNRFLKDQASSKTAWLSHQCRHLWRLWTLVKYQRVVASHITATHRCLRPSLTTKIQALKWMMLRLMASKKSRSLPTISNPPRSKLRRYPTTSWWDSTCSIKWFRPIKLGRPIRSRWSWDWWNSKHWTRDNQVKICWQPGQISRPNSTLHLECLPRSQACLYQGAVWWSHQQLVQECH